MSLFSYHGKADIGLLQGRAVVGSITRHCHHLSLVHHGAVNDSCEKTRWTVGSFSRQSKLGQNQ